MFAAALVADVKHQVGVVRQAMAQLADQFDALWVAGETAKAQGVSATMFTMFPAVLAGEAFLANAAKVDVGAEQDGNALLAPVLLGAITTGTRLTEPRAHGPIASLAHTYLVESMCEMAKSISAAREEYERRMTTGEFPNQVLDDMFPESRGVETNTLDAALRASNAEEAHGRLQAH